MDPVNRVRDFLLDNVGHMTYPGNATLDPGSQHWLVPVYCRGRRGNFVVGDIELDCDGHIIFAPSKEEMLARLTAASTRGSAGQPVTAFNPSPQSGV
jgi:hypothetical protein